MVFREHFFALLDRREELVNKKFKIWFYIDDGFVNFDKC